MATQVWKSDLDGSEHATEREANEYDEKRLAGPYTLTINDRTAVNIITSATDLNMRLAYNLSNLEIKFIEKLVSRANIAVEHVGECRDCYIKYNKRFD